MGPAYVRVTAHIGGIGRDLVILVVALGRSPALPLVVRLGLDLWQGYLKVKVIAAHIHIAIAILVVDSFIADWGFGLGLESRVSQLCALEAAAAGPIWDAGSAVVRTNAVVIILDAEALGLV